MTCVRRGIYVFLSWKNSAVSDTFTESFWQKNNMSGSRVELKNIKGYFTAIPVHWTEGENNLLPYNMRLIASNDVRKDDEYQIADNRTINGFEGDLS